MDRNTHEEILTSLRRTISEKFGAGEGHPELSEHSVRGDVAEGTDSNKTEAVKHKVPSTKWASLTRAFRLGLAVGTTPDLPDIPSSQIEEITTHSKRGSLGKIFRHGFGHKSPTTVKDLDNNCCATFKDVTPPQNKRGSLARIFKQPKTADVEGNQVYESENCEVAGAKKETKKHQLGKILRQKFGSDKRKPATEEILANTEPLYSADPSAPNPEQRRRSLGKMFRLKQNNRVSKEVSHPSSEASGSSDKLAET